MSPQVTVYFQNCQNWHTDQSILELGPSNTEVLASDSQHKGSNATSVRSLVLHEKKDETKTQVGVSALSVVKSVQSFDTVGW